MSKRGTWQIWRFGKQNRWRMFNF